MILHLQCFHSCKRTESRIKQGEFFGPYKDSSIITFAVVAFFITFHVILKINRSAYMKTRSDEYFTKRPICTSKIFVVNHCIKKNADLSRRTLLKKFCTTDISLGIWIHPEQIFSTTYFRVCFKKKENRYYIIS